MGQDDQEADESPTPTLSDFQARLQAIVRQQVAEAHGDILRELAASEVARKEAELAADDLRKTLAIARETLNAMRGVKPGAGEGWEG